MLLTLTPRVLERHILCSLLFQEDNDNFGFFLVMNSAGNVGLDRYWTEWLGYSHKAKSNTVMSLGASYTHFGTFVLWLES